MKRILETLPDDFRRRSLRLIASGFLRAALNFAGVAALLPLLMLLLDPAVFSGNGSVARLYAHSGIGSERGFVAAACGAVVLFTLGKGAVDRLLIRYENRWINDLQQTLARRLYLSYRGRGLAFIDREDPLSLARRIDVTTRAFAAGVVRPAATILAEGAMLGMLLLALALVHPGTAAMVALLFGPAGWLYERFVRRRIARSAEAVDRARRTKQRLLVETFRGYADIELNGAADEMLREYDRVQEQESRARMEECGLRSLPAFLLENCVAVGLALLAVASFGREDAALRFGIFALAALRLTPSVRSLMNARASIRRNRSALATMYRARKSAADAQTPIPPKTTQPSATTQSPKTPEPSVATQSPGLPELKDRHATKAPDRGRTEASKVSRPEETPDDRGSCPAAAADDPGPEARGSLTFEREIRLQGISFRYPGETREVIHDLNLSIQKGDRIGINGRSGIGKTTLLRLVAGLYEPSAGEIRIDGEQLAANNLRAWHARIGYVAQRPFFRIGTLAENLAPGIDRKLIDPVRMAEAIRSARLEQLVAELPRGIDTPIGAYAGRLSGGQLQRIAIARALYRQADLLLLDEATSSLDSRTEAELQAALEELLNRNPHLTLIMVAHRPESLAACRRLLQLDNRKIKEITRHGV